MNLRTLILLPILAIYAWCISAHLFRIRVTGAFITDDRTFTFLGQQFGTVDFVGAQ